MVETLMTNTKKSVNNLHKISFYLEPTRTSAQIKLHPSSSDFVIFRDEHAPTIPNKAGTVNIAVPWPNLRVKFEEVVLLVRHQQHLPAVLNTIETTPLKGNSFTFTQLNNC